MRKLSGVLFLLTLCSWACAQTINYPVFLIPDSLKNDAFAVVRDLTTEYEYKSDKQGVEKHSFVVTVLYEKGKQDADFVYYGDKFRELKKFSAKLYDSKGQLLRKFKMSDVAVSEWSDGLATDDKVYYFNCQSPGYPYTVHYEYEINWKKGIFLFPGFFPQNNYHLAVENARYIVTVPEGLKLRKKVINMPDEPAQEVKNNFVTYTWKVENLKPFTAEVFSPTLKHHVPIIYLSPETFVYDGIAGSISDWQSYGSWVYGLTKDRNTLSDQAKEKIVQLTKDAKTDREKVELLYKYLGETTRYVSIQLGIGGYQPMTSGEVYKTGFGDCKALSFYMKSMLEVVGIPSNYILIRSDLRNKTLYPDYAGFNEINHAILQVPLEQDTLWLECTNPKIPFGYVHSNIAGHNALEVTENGGKMCVLPDYPDSLNLEKNTAKIIFDSDEIAQIASTKEYYLDIYKNNMGYPAMKRSEQVDKLRRGIKLPDVTIGDLNFREDKSSLPNLKIDYSWSTRSYGTKTGNRLFIPLNPFRSPYKWISKKERKNDVDLYYGFYDVDDITIVIPEGYQIETLPESFEYNTQYGKFKSSVVANDSEIRVVQKYFQPKGEYPVSEYADIRSFVEKINSAYDGKIILKKIN